MKTCPTCGQPILQTSAEQVLALLHDTRGGRCRDIYKAQDGNWYITYGGGSFANSVVQHLIDTGKIVRTYDECADSFTVGKTMAVQTTQEARSRRELAKGEVIYTDGSRGP